MTEYTIYHLPTVGTGVKFIEAGNPVYVPTFEISDGKVLPRKLPEGFIKGSPITLADIRQQVNWSMDAANNYKPGVKHFCHVVLFDDNPYEMGVMLTEKEDVHLD